MKKALKVLILWGVVALFGIMPNNYLEVEAAQNNVPAYYYANYKFIDDWNQIKDIFWTIQARISVGFGVEQSMLSELYTHFVNTFPYFPQNYKTTYEKCILLADDLRKWYSTSSMDGLMWNSCYNRLQSAINEIESKYTVHPTYTINPTNWMAPLTVTFDARASSDPSSETIPANNFYWYYRDEKGVDTPIGQWQVITYTFEEAGKFIVHLVVRSSNVDKGILDGEQDIEVNVTPKAANIVVYANTRRMTKNSPIKIWTSEWEKWVVFDGSATMPRENRKILSHSWRVENDQSWFLYTENNNWSPSYMKPLVIKENWKYKVTLTTKDNENNIVSETFELYISDPVSVIKQSPAEWNTSTVMTFDGSASYSIKSRLNTYAREIFDEEGDKIDMEQWKQMNKIFIKPWNYLVRLTVTTLDEALQNEDIKEVFIESTTPTPQFIVTPTSKWTYPSEFTLDASSSTDIDVLRWEDSLEYSWKFSTEDYKIISTQDNNRRIVVQFDDVGTHAVELRVTDKYWKHAEITKNIEVQSTLRPEIEAIPGAITRWKEMQFKATVNKPDTISTYMWNFWDWKVLDSQFATDVKHIYWQRWVYPVTLTVYDKKWNYNTVTERVFIWEVEFPIAAYRVTDGQWFYIQASDECKIEGSNVPQLAYSIDRYESFTVNPSISVNTQGNSNWLEYVFEPESIIGSTQAIVTSSLTHRFSQVGCHYIDLTVQDSNIWKQDKTRIWFNVKNALPKLSNVTLSFPQYWDNSSAIWFGAATNSTTNQTVFSCNSWSSNNVTIKVTAVDAYDSDWTVSRLRFYYYNIDDPNRILDSKETWINNPYVYFSIPRIGWEYKFGVMVYDNDGWMIDSEEYLSSNPSIYFPSCNDSDVPTVTLRLSSQNIEIWDTVTYSIVSRITSNNQDFDTDRTFYYDFTWDWTWDLVTKKDTATYTFMEPYENGVSPRAAVEYRWKLWIWDGAKIYVKNWIKPILLYNSIGNTVIFRDMSIWTFQQRQICFDVEQCKLWNTKYQKTHIVTLSKELENLNVWPSTTITENDSFLQKYSDYWTHNVSLYLKNRYGVEVSKWFTVKTSNNSDNWRIAPWINMITIPETTFNNTNPEIFLSKAMNNTVLMYINNDTWEDCYVDMDISKDSDWDSKTDNDIDILCNKMAKIVYQPNYESAIWRIYFMNNWQLTFKNFYVQFEWYILELDEEKLAIYKDITTLMNWIEDISIANANLKSSLDMLRKNLNNITVVTPTVIAINEQIDAWWIKLDQRQKDLLDSILDRLSNADTIISVWLSEYEINKMDILVSVPKTHKIRASVEEWFLNFEESSSPEEKGKILTDLMNNILKNVNLDSSDVSIIQWRFCSISEYYSLWSYAKVCPSDWGKTWLSSSQNTPEKSWWLPGRLKIVLFVLVGWLLAMWWIILFFSIKAKLSSSEEDEW